MKRTIAAILSILWCGSIFSQKAAFEKLLSDSTMLNSSVSFCLMRADTQDVIFEYNAGISLIPGSVLKLYASAAALELLGPEHTFTTSVGFTGKLNKRSGVLDGDIIIKGGGDPSLGSENFAEHYGDFLSGWVDAIKKAGIRKIRGRVITDDSYYDYQPIPAKWLWEDAGNYYGAGAFGLSVFDNTYEIHFRTSSDSSAQDITGIYPEECAFEFANWLVAAGTADKGYVFAAPYSTNGWLSGTIPANTDDFILKASVADPPSLIARITDKKLREAGITISGGPTTTRLLMSVPGGQFTMITMTVSPPLSDILEVLLHESVNMYAEHCVKELGRVYGTRGSTEAGLAVIRAFIDSTGLGNTGIHLEDGSGLSPLNSINAKGLTELLYYMRNKAGHSAYFYDALPDAGKEGTLKNYFRDPLFENRMKAKSGSMTRVRSYSGYLKTLSGKELIFSIMINNFNGTPRYNISLIEDVLKQVITDN